MSGDAQLISSDATDRLLTALGEQLGLLGERYDLVVIGGAALLARGLVSRPSETSTSSRSLAATGSCRPSRCRGRWPKLALASRATSTFRPTD